jgi:hypothetical protein
MSSLDTGLVLVLVLVLVLGSPSFHVLDWVPPTRRSGSPGESPSARDLVGLGLACGRVLRPARESEHVPEMEADCAASSMLALPLLREDLTRLVSTRLVSSPMSRSAAKPASADDGETVCLPPSTRQLTLAVSMKIRPASLASKNRGVCRRRRHGPVVSFGVVELTVGPSHHRRRSGGRRRRRRRSRRGIGRRSA